MYNIYFDLQDGMVLIDGHKLHTPVFYANEDKYAICFIPNDILTNPIFTILNINNHMNPYLDITKISENKLYVSFNHIDFGIPQPEAYYQQTLDSTQKKHFMTFYQANNSYFITLETDTEIYNINTISKLSDIKLSIDNISSGQLITIIAKAKDKMFLNIIFYNDDYCSLLKCHCDEVLNENGTLIIRDKMNDSLKRTISRHFVFKDGVYSEIKREFSYAITPIIIDEILPFVFLESVFAKDYLYSKTLLSDNLKNLDSESFFGDFLKILNLEELNYIPYQISILCNKKSQKFIKTFDFIINNHLIDNIIMIEK